MIEHPNPVEPFEKKKRDYFIELGLEVRDALALHRTVGLRDRDPETGNIDWQNVSEHCIVEAARARMFARVLGFSGELQHDVTTAAMLHDYSKQQEKDIILSEGVSLASFEHASEVSSQGMLDAGFDSGIVNLAGSVSHESLTEIEQLLNKEALTQYETAQLVLHYIDDYTINADWVEAPDAFEARMQKNDNNERYRPMNEEGRAIFEGRTTFEEMRRVGRAVEDRLADLVQEKTGINMRGAEVPHYIDSLIRKEIEEL